MSTQHLTEDDMVKTGARLVRIPRPMAGTTMRVARDWVTAPHGEFMRVLRYFTDIRNVLRDRGIELKFCDNATIANVCLTIREIARTTTQRTRIANYSEEQAVRYRYTLPERTRCRQRCVRYLNEVLAALQQGGAL